MKNPDFGEKVIEEIEGIVLRKRNTVLSTNLLRLNNLYPQLRRIEAKIKATAIKLNLFIKKNQINKEIKKLNGIS